MFYLASLFALQMTVTMENPSLVGAIDIDYVCMTGESGRLSLSGSTSSTSFSNDYEIDCAEDTKIAGFKGVFTRTGKKCVTNGGTTYIEITSCPQ